MFKILFALAMLLSVPALSCRMLPIEKNVDKYIYDWVKSSPDIYLAEAVSFAKDEEAVSFKVKEVIKGEKVPTVSVSGSVGSANTSDFGVHRKDGFWNSIIEGRTAYDEGCRFKPEFEIGRTYLLIMKEPFQAKSFELIKNKSDWWYFRVKEIGDLKKYRRFVVKKEKSKIEQNDVPKTE